MSKEDTVVVTSSLDLYKGSSKPYIVARLVDLGLTAYGDTEEECMDALKRLFNKFIHTYRENGQLVKRLNQAGVDWQWEKDYPTDAPSYENTNAVGNSCIATELPTDKDLLGSNNRENRVGKNILSSNNHESRERYAGFRVAA